MLAENTVAGVNYYLDEIARRENKRQQETMIRLTWAIAGMTLVVTIATIVKPGSVVASARNPPVLYHGPVLAHPRAIAKPQFGDTSGGA